MAHQVEQMAYVGRTPWHGLGNKLPEQQPLEVWMEQAGLDWTIHETPVRFINGNKGHLGEILSFDDHKVLYRSDTHAPLSVVSQRYQVVQPREIMEFYRDLTEKSGFELETAGSLKGGRKIWALARTGQSGVLKGSDRTDAYVLLATACDGTLATTAQFTSVRVVCNNTLAVALNGQSQCVKVSHRSVFDAEAVKKQMGISVSAWDDFMYSLKALSERKVKQSELRSSSACCSSRARSRLHRSPTSGRWSRCSHCSVVRVAALTCPHLAALRMACSMPSPSSLTTSAGRATPTTDWTRPGSGRAPQSSERH